MSYAYSEITNSVLPATEKQILFARKLAQKNHVVLPWGVLQERHTLSAWIDAQVKTTAVSDRRPSSKQVGFAERIARIRRGNIPDECFRDRGLMSSWINANTP